MWNVEKVLKVKELEFKTSIAVKCPNNETVANIESCHTCFFTGATIVMAQYLAVLCVEM